MDALTIPSSVPIPAAWFSLDKRWHEQALLAHRAIPSSEDTRIVLPGSSSIVEISDSSAVPGFLPSST
jgi:hypothetical protein